MTEKDFDNLEQVDSDISEEAELSAATGTTSSCIVLGQDFTIDERFKVIEPLGIGAYGLVVAAKDTKL